MNLTPEQIAARLAERNPFATRSVRPGILSYRFPNGDTTDGLIDVLRSNHWRGEIIGPHGSGKSTLIQTLIPLLRDAGRDVRQFSLHAGDSRLPVHGGDMQTWGPTSQLIIDGYEQLGSWNRAILNRICAKQGCGLLVTAHASVGFPPLFQNTPSLSITQAIVREIQPCDPLRVLDHDVAISFEKHGGNIREVFFELHDLYEQRR